MSRCTLRVPLTVHLLVLLILQIEPSNSVCLHPDQCPNSLTRQEVQTSLHCIELFFESPFSRRCSPFLALLLLLSSSSARPPLWKSLKPRKTLQVSVFKCVLISVVRCWRGWSNFDRTDRASQQDKPYTPGLVEGSGLRVSTHLAVLEQDALYILGLVQCPPGGLPLLELPPRLVSVPNTLCVLFHDSASRVKF
jgi:hypothetical protein